MIISVKIKEYIPILTLMAGGQEGSGKEGREASVEQATSNSYM